MESKIESQDQKNIVRWFVMSAYKQEKLAEERLSREDGLEYYIAKHYVVRTYHGKKTKVQVPYIPNIIFVHATQAEIVEFKERNNFIRFVTWNKSTGKEYLIVPDKQMDDFIRVSSSEEESVKYYKPDEVNLKKGTRVRIIGGIFDGVEGVFIKKGRAAQGNLFVMIDGFVGVSVNIAPDLIQVIK